MAQLNRSLDAMPAKSRALYDELKAKRGSLDGMYMTLLNHPDLTERVSATGQLSAIWVDAAGRRSRGDDPRDGACVVSRI